MFIILHRENGAEVMINVRNIESVTGSYVNFKEYSYTVKESYEEIKEAMKKAMEIDTE